VGCGRAARGWFLSVLLASTAGGLADAITTAPATPAAPAVAAFPVALSATNPAAILAIMERVADWQLAHPSRHRPTDWTEGAKCAGFMALAGVSENPKYRDAMLAMGNSNAWQLGPRSYDADDHVIGQTYAELYLQKKDPRMIAPMRRGFDEVLAHPAQFPSLEFSQRKIGNVWSWCDSLFMAPPAWIRLWSATGNRAYLDFAVDRWWITSDYLYDRDEHLYFRDSSYFSKREANGQKVFWARGNGWVMGGLVRMLQYLPADHPVRPRFERQFREMADRLISLQQDDGFWRASLLDPASYPAKEESGTGFYCYALAWGVNHGLVDRAAGLPAVLKAWQALGSCVLPDGRLIHVQPVGADPKKFDENSTEPYGVGAFLLAGSEVFRLGEPAARTPAVR